MQKYLRINGEYVNTGKAAYMIFSLPGKYELITKKIIGLTINSDKGKVRIDGASVTKIPMIGEGRFYCGAITNELASYLHEEGSGIEKK